MKKFIVYGTAALVTVAAMMPVSADAASGRDMPTNSIVKRVVISNRDCSPAALKEKLESLGLDENCLRWNGLIGNINGSSNCPFFPGESNPGTDAPDAEMPENNVPETETPEIEVPKPEKPEPETPKPEKPEYETPDINVPEVEVPDQESGSGNDTENSTDQTFAQQIVSLVNAERAKEGLAPLSVDVKVEIAALVRAKEIQGSFSHTRPNGSSFSTVLKENGVSYRGAGENIAWGQKTPKQVMDAWMNSPSHRANIMNKNYTSIGVGYLQNTGGVPYWVQLFTY